MTVSKDDAKARRGFCALLLAGLGILAVGKWTDTLALKDGLLAALVLLACSLAVQCLPRRVRAFALVAAVPVLAQCLQAVSTDIGVFLYFKLLPKLWALALWLLLFCLLWGLLGRPGLAGGVCVTVSVLLALLNLALLQFRGTALQWQDIGSWRPCTGRAACARAHPGRPGSGRPWALGPLQPVCCCGSRRSFRPAG